MATKAKSAKSAAAELSGETVAPRLPSTFTMPSGFKAKRVLTLPSLVMKTEGEPKVLQIMEEIHLSSVKGKILPDGTQEKPANVCGVIDTETGEQLIFLVPTVVQKNLEEGYPDGGYVGLTFYVENLGKSKSGQRYNNFKIIELEAE